MDWNRETFLDVSSRGIADTVAAAIRNGVLVEGSQLPTIRAIARELGISPSTVNAAWGVLSRSGVVITGRRRGTIVAPTSPDDLRYPRAVNPLATARLDLSTGVPDPALLPDLRTAITALSTVAAPGSYLDVPVLPELEQLVISSWPFAQHRLTFVDGAMDALDLTTRALLTFGDRVVVETPTFPPLLDLLEAHRVDIHAVPIDEEGISMDAVVAASTKPVRAVFLQPRAQNPTGVSMTARRAEDLGTLYDASDTIIVEDDSCAGVAHAPPVSVGTWLPNQTVHIRSFSKSHGPDLRLAALSAPQSLFDHITAIRQRGQGWSSRLLQRVLLELLRDETVNDQIHAARLVYADRRTRVIQALADAGIDCGGTDGYNVWIPVQDETSAVLALAHHGIAVAPGSPFVAGPPAPAHIRITVSGVDEAGPQLEALVRTIAGACRTTHRAVV